MAKFYFSLGFDSPSALLGFTEKEKQEITDIASSLNPLPSKLSYSNKLTHSNPIATRADIGFYVDCDSQFAAAQIQNDLRKQIAKSSLARYQCDSDHPSDRK